MNSFQGKIAVVTGGASGMGRALTRQLATEGCDVAICDLSEVEMHETVELALADAAAGGHDGVCVTGHLCDVADEAAILGFRDEVEAQHQTDHLNLLFNNAGISGGASLFTASRESWDRCFSICWGGVYHGTRAFLPLLVAADEGHIINTSSVNGFWASLGPDHPHTAYSAAKFAVKGFTEALVVDLRINAPHVKASVVMPGHIGTGIVASSLRHGVDEISDEIRDFMEMVAEEFRKSAPVTAEEAATVILDGIRQERWRILVGDDARALDEAVRAAPELAYDSDAFLSVLREAGDEVD